MGRRRSDSSASSQSVQRAEFLASAGVSVCITHCHRSSVLTPATRRPPKAALDAADLSALPEQLIEGRPRPLDFGGRRHERALAWPEVIAEVRVLLVAHFLRGGFATMFRDTRVVLDTQPAYVKLRAARGALIEAQQRQRERRERCATLPAYEVVGHRGTVARSSSRRASANISAWFVQHKVSRHLLPRENSWPFPGALSWWAAAASGR